MISSAATIALPLLLWAGWTDPTGRLRCEVPDTFTPHAEQPWRFSRADGLRQLVFLTVKPVPAGPTERAQQLLERTGATAIATTDGGATGTLADAGTPLAAAFAIAAQQPGWAGVLVLGPPAADVSAEAAALAATCRRQSPAVAGGRIYDSTRRLSAAIPFGLESLDIRGAGTVQSEGFSIRVTAVQPKTKPTLQEIAVDWLAPSGAKLTATAGASAGAENFPVVISTGTLTTNGFDYIIEIVAIDLGNGEVGGLGLSTHRSTATRARATLDQLLRTITVAPAIEAP